MNLKQFEELLFQALETEMGGVLIYEAAIKNLVNEELKSEFEEYHTQTLRHVEIMEKLVKDFGLDSNKQTPGREIVRAKGKALAAAIEKAKQAGDPNAAQLVAVECVVDAETKDHLNWELFSEVSKDLPKKESKLLQDACKEVEKEEDRHFYHSAGWARELWLEFLGLPAILPPPEERKKVETEVEAGRAKEQRERMLHKGHATHARR